jgi:predicted DNA-binding mobile mystery protein A
MNPIQRQTIITRQISRRLENLRACSQGTQGISSWIDYVRKGLGMSLVQLAKRVGVTQSSMSVSIKTEKEKRITLNRLTQIADAMDCDLVYGFVPRKKIEDLMLDQAVKKTRQLMDHAETHMELEGKKVKIDKAERINDLAETRRYSKYLWDDYSA